MSNLVGVVFLFAYFVIGAILAHANTRGNSAVAIFFWPLYLLIDIFFNDRHKDT